MSFWKRTLLINLAVVLGIAVGLSLFSLTSWGRVFVKTVLLIPEVWPNASVHPLHWVTKEPLIEEIEIPSEGSLIKANVYRPADSKKHTLAVLMLVGVDPESTLVTRYAKGFSRLGLTIVVPVIPNLARKDTLLEVGQIGDLISVFESLREKEYVNPNKTGFIGISMGGTLSLLASEDPSIADKVDFIITVSPYFDPRMSSAQVYTQTLIEDGKITPWQPVPENIKGFNRFIINTLPYGEDRMLLEKYERGESMDEDLDRLSPDGHRVLDLLSFPRVEQNTPIGEKLDKFFRIYDTLPGPTKGVLEKMSPDIKIKNISAKVYVLNQPNNNNIWSPYTDSLRLVKSLREDQREYIEVAFLEHSQLLRRLPRLKTLKELFKLELFISKVLAGIL